MTAARLLLVEDEPDLARTLRDNLVAEGHEVEWLVEGTAALERVRRQSFDLVILDVMLPGLNGFEICRQLREEGKTTAILFLTALGDTEDRIHGLQVGGDDYLPKPFELRELLARVAAILRRRRQPGAMSMAPVIRFGRNRVDLDAYRGRDATGREHALTHKEAMILRLLVTRSGRVVSRNEILDAVWGTGSAPSTRTIDNFIARLRQRFEVEPKTPHHFHTVRGIGYRFTEEPE